MQSAEHFLQDYLQSRAKVVREQWAIHQPHGRRFFAPDYEPWDIDGPIAGVEGERIVTVSTSGDEPEIVTTRDEWGKARLTRYLLSATNGSWRIVSMEYACHLCQGSGKNDSGDCRVCAGTGWCLIGKKHLTSRRTE
jgi:hypothetical protein